MEFKFENIRDTFYEHQSGKSICLFSRSLKLPFQLYLMPDRPISRCTLNNLNSYRMSLLLAIGRLQGIEDTTANPCHRPSVSRTTTSTHATQVCEGCHAIGHHYTKKCHNHQYVWDSSANAHLLQPGERVARPADWQDIYRASLHHIIHTALQYYISLHHMRIQDIHTTLLTELELNSQFGEISVALSPMVPQANLLLLKMPTIEPS
jgi:hypothetical protein